MIPRTISSHYKCFAVVLIAAFSILATSSAHAFSEKILNKSLAEGIYNCYVGGLMKTPVQVNKVNSSKDIIESDSDSTKLPNGATAVKDATLSCRQLLTDGGEGWTAITSYPNSSLSLGNYLSGKLDYEKGEAEVLGGMCVYYYYVESSQREVGWELLTGDDIKKTYYLCADRLTDAVESTDPQGQPVIDGKIYVDKMSVDKSEGSDDYVEFEIGNKEKIKLDCATYNGFSDGGCGYVYWTKGTTMWSAFRTDVATELYTKAQTRHINIPCNQTPMGCVGGGDFYYYFDVDQQHQKVYGEITTDELTRKYKLEGSMSAHGMNVANTLLGSGTNYSSLALNENEKFYLMQYYLSTFYAGNTICDVDESDPTIFAANTAGRTEIKFYDKESGTIKEHCWAKGTANTDKTVWGPITASGASQNHFAQAWKLQNVLDWLHSTSVTSLPDDLAADLSTVSSVHTPDPPETDPGTPEEQKPECTNNAGALGWIICPLITSASDALEKVYEDMIVPYLRIDAYLLDRSGKGENVYKVWQAFQTFANLAFVALFLFVIFSQLTGIGIDNYGIKKILPKLIIGAVLINLSYIICQLAVDISNIIGGGVGSLFNRIQMDQIQNIEIQLNSSYSETWNAWSGSLVVVGLIAAMGVGIFLAGGLAIIVPILLALLSLLVGVFFTYAMLAIRQAIAIILVVVSPLAFVCYILPNSKKIFDRWFEMFKGLLITYPLMSALIYGGDLVAKILLLAQPSTTITSLGIVISAAIVSVAPIFFLPSLLKKSLNGINGLGNIMAKSQGRVGSALRNPAERRLNNSWLTNGRRRREENRDQREKSRNQRRLMRQSGLAYNEDGTIRVTDRGQRMAARAQGMKGARGEAARAALAARRNQAISGVSADMNTARILSDGGVAATLAGLNTKQEQQEVADEIINMAKDTGNYDIDTMQDQLQGLMSKDTLTAEETVRARALASKLSESGFGAKGLAKIFSSSSTKSAARREMADYITSTDVANKLGNKDMYVAQYMRDIAANTSMRDTQGNQVVAGNLDFDSWAMAQRSDGKGGSITNVEHVAKNILDDDELLAKQATASLERTMAVDEDRNGAVGNGEGSYIDSGGNRHTFIIHKTGVDAISHNRAQKIINNENIHTKEEQDKILGRR